MTVIEPLPPYILPGEEVPEPSRPLPDRSLLGYAAALLALVPLALAGRELWAAQALTLALLLTVPGLLALRALRVPATAVTAFPMYVPAASTLVVTGAALAVNYVAPVLGAADPLRTGPLLIGIEATCALLLAIGAPARETSRVAWSQIRIPVWRAWPLLLPALSAAGAVRLTGGHGNAVAVAGIAATGLALLGAVLAAPRLSRGQLSCLLFSAALALSWSFSLRGPFVYGFDISTEFHVLTQTLSVGHWNAPHHDDAYGAMLSLSVFPAALNQLTGIASLALLKVVYPLFIALFPVALFRLAERVLERRWAFVAAAFIVVQSYLFQQMVAIGRQEVALFMFVVLVAAALDELIPRRSRWGLVALLALGVVVAHYSTTYLAIGMFAAAALLQLAVSTFRPMPRATGAVLVAAVVLAAGAGAWYGPVTHSASNVGSFSSDLRDKGLDLLPNAKPGQSLVQTYLSGNVQTKVDAAEYGRLVRSDFAKQRKYVHPLPSARDSRYRLQDASVARARSRAPVVSQGVQDLQPIVAQIANLLALIGALALALSRRSSRSLRAIGLLGAGTLGVLAFIRLSGTAAEAYNQERAFVQTMVPLSIALAAVLQGASRWRDARALRAIVPILAIAGLGALLVNTSGLRGGVLGGYAPTNVTNSGEDYERFYATQPELAAAHWLGQVPRKSLVYSDRYGSLRVLAATGRYRGLLQAVTPRTLNRTAWVYRSAVNTRGRARGELNNHYSVYRWPGRFLDERFNSVYTNGTSGVYHR